MNSSSGEDSDTTLIPEESHIESESEHLDSEGKSPALSTPEHSRRTQSSPTLSTVEFDFEPFGSEVSVSPAAPEGDTLEELERFIDKAHRYSLGEDREAFQKELEELGNREKEDQRARLGLERVAQGLLQQEIDQKQWEKIRQELEIIRQEVAEAKANQEQERYYLQEYLKRTEDPYLTEPERLVTPIQEELDKLRIEVDQRLLEQKIPSEEEEQDVREWEEWEADRIQEQRELEERLLGYSTSDSGTEETEEDIQVPIMAAQDPLRNIPRYYGTEKDVLTAQQHIEAFEDYLRAYNLYRYVNLGVAPAAPGYAAATQDRSREIVKRLGFSLQGEAKTWFHEQQHFALPAAPDITDYDDLKQRFLRRFNPYGRTQQELNIEWESIRADESKSIEAIWMKIQTIGNGLGYNNAQMTEKLRICLPPNVYAATVQINDAHAILNIARRMNAYQRGRGVTNPVVPPPPLPDPTPPFLYADDFHRATNPNPNPKPEIPNKMARRMTKLETGLSTLIDAQQDLCVKMERLATKDQQTTRARPTSRSRYRSTSRSRSRDAGRSNRRSKKDYSQSPDRRTKQVRFKEAIAYVDNSRQRRDDRSATPVRRNDNRPSFKCHWCKKEGHSYRNCFRLKNIMRQIEQLKKTTKRPDDADAEEQEDDDEDVLSMMENDEITFQEITDIVKHFQIDDLANC